MDKLNKINKNLASKKCITKGCGVIRVRFAPSPTGYLHIGGLRTCLYNWLFAQKNKGKLILRIEDTDRERYVEGATEGLIKTLKLMGLKRDEGPILPKGQKNFQFPISNFQYKGKFGPYLQSQRLQIYQNLALKLVEAGHAYYCFCTPQELEAMRQAQTAQKLPPIYNRHCRNLNKEELKRRLQAGQPYVIRLKVPEQESPPSPNGLRRTSIKFKDLIRGEVEFDLKTVDDQILIKSDGWPTYHLANVIDDHLMGITHVIRGEEWLPSGPKHLLIYQFLGWQPPKFAHLPLILNPDRSKLSKRQGDVAVEDYLAQGYLPEALLNFIALLGWNPDTNQEIFTIKDLIKQFSLEKIQKAGAVFNREKLDWINGRYIRKMSVRDLTIKCLPYLVQAGLIMPLNPKFEIRNSKQISKSKFQIPETGEIVDFKWLTKIVALEQERLKRLDEIAERTKFFFVDKLDYDPKILIWRKMTAESAKQNLILVKNELEKLSAGKFKIKNIQEILNDLAKKQGAGEIFWPFRVALTGQQASPPPAEIAEILKKEKVLKRIETALKLLKHYDKEGR